MQYFTYYYMAGIIDKRMLRVIAQNPFCAWQWGDVRVATDFRSPSEQQGLGYVFCSSPSGEHFSQAKLGLDGTLLVNLGMQGEAARPLVLRFNQLPAGKYFLRGSLVRGDGSGHEVVAANLVGCSGGSREFSKFPIEPQARTIDLINPLEKYVPLVVMLDSLSKRGGLAGQLDARAVPQDAFQIRFDAAPAYQDFTQPTPVVGYA